MSEEHPHRDLERLDDRLAKARGNAGLTGAGKQQKNTAPGNALGLAFRIGVELVSALAIGVGIGWLLDSWLGTKPWLMLVFILLGGGAGVLNVYRVASGFGYAVGYPKDQGAGDDKPGEQSPEIED